MNMFEQDKAAKLKRKRGLRIANALGMVAWREDRYNCAQQKLRMLHPLSWLWVFILTVVSIFGQGIPDTYRDLKRALVDECVWW